MTWARGIYSTRRTATERKNLGIWARDSFATREGAQGHGERERRGVRYGLYARVVVNADMRQIQLYIWYFLESNYG
jgi:hypothetical protein